uniref:Uncharacterized protein n=1 Tax=Arundo donax TaxID=35708 RepID=A0A0A9I1W9_ARUDO
MSMFAQSKPQWTHDVGISAPLAHQRCQTSNHAGHGTDLIQSFPTAKCSGHKLLFLHPSAAAPFVPLARPLLLDPVATPVTPISLHNFYGCFLPSGILAF